MLEPVETVISWGLGIMELPSSFLDVPQGITWTMNVSFLGNILNGSPSLLAMGTQWHFAIEGILLLLLVAFFLRMTRDHQELKRRHQFQKLTHERYLVINREGRILRQNPGDFVFPKDIPSNPRILEELPNPEFIKRLREQIAVVLKSGKTAYLDYTERGTRRTGTLRRLPWDLYRQETVFWSSQNTDELHQAREKADLLNTKLSDLVLQYEFLLNSMPVYFYVEDANNNFRHIHCNAICSELWNRPVEEVLGKNDEQLFGDSQEIRLFRETDLAAMESDEVREDVQSFTGADGKQRIGRFYRKRIQLSGGRRWMFGIAVDITEEEERRNRVASLMDTIEYTSTLTHSAVFRYNLRTQEITGTKNLADLIPIENGRPLSLERFASPEDQDRVRDACKQLMDGEIDQVNLDYRTFFSGEPRYYRLNAVMDQRDPESISLLGVVQDMSHRVLDQQKIQEMALFQDLVIHTVPSILFVCDADQNYRYRLVNRAFAQQLDQPLENIIGKNHQEVFGFPLSESVQNNNQESLRTPEGVTSNELIRNPCGESRLYRMTRKSFTGPHGETFVLGVGDDITELNELIQNQKVLNDCFSEFLSSDQFDAREHILQMLCARLKASRCFLMRYQYDDDSKGDEIPSRMVPDQEYCVLTPDGPALNVQIAKMFSADNEWFHRLYRKSFLEVPDIHVSQTIQAHPQWQKTCEEFHLQSLGILQILVQGKIWGFIGITYEETPHSFLEYEDDFLRSGAHLVGLMLQIHQSYQKMSRVMEELRSTVKQLESGAQLTHSASFRMDHQHRIVSCTAEMSSLFPIQDGRILLPEQWICDEDVPRAQHCLERLNTNQTTREIFEFRSDYFGPRRHYRVQLSQENSASIFYGVVQDVTEIARSAVQLRETQELWEQVINSIPTMFFAKDADDHFRYHLCNQSFAKFVGKTPEEVVGKTDFQLFTPQEESQMYIECDVQAMHHPKGTNFEEQSTDCEGKIHRIRTFKKPFITASGKRLLLGVCDDITTLYRAIQYEQMNNEVLKYMVSESSTALVFDQVAQALRTAFPNSCRVTIVEFDDHVSKFRMELCDPKCRLDITPGADCVEYWKPRRDLFRKMPFSLDLTELPEIREDPPRYPNSSTGTIASSSIFVAGELWGALFVSFPQKYSLIGSDEKFMLSMANIIALAQIREYQLQAVRRAEEENQLILDNVDVPIWLYDTRGVVVRTNQAAQQLVGLSQIGTAPFACHNILQCGRNSQSCPVYCSLQDSSPHQSSLKFKGHDYLINTRPITDEKGHIVHIVKNALDITELHSLIGNQKVINGCLSNLIRENDQILAIKHSLKEICEHIGASRCYIFQFNSQEQTVSCFAEYAQAGLPHIFEGFHPHPCSVQPRWEKRFTDTPLIAIPNILQDYITEGLSSWEGIIKKAQCHSLYAYRIMLSDQLWGYIGLAWGDEIHQLTPREEEFFRSIARCVELLLIRQQYQKQSLQALEQAKAAERAKSEFLASMSHEIRTPLNAVIGFSELLKEDTLSAEDQQDYLQCISSAGNSLLALINDVLDLSRLEADRMVFTLVDVNFFKLVTEYEAYFPTKMF